VVSTGDTNIPRGFMSRRIPVMLLAGSVLVTVACTNKKVQNPIANIDSKQPDKVLFDRSMDALKHNRFDVARMTLQTLINTYPDSEFIARAKLGVADSWYAEGGTAGLAQAEIEYNDFKTFFPNMAEAAEAQLKIANIHYQQMEKADRDFTHAMRAEDEYRNLIMQFPDSKLVPEAKLRLMEIQEVLADREYGIGRFYYMRQSYPAAIARLKSVIERYPLYSRVDESLFLLGQSYEGEIATVRSHNAAETVKANMIQSLTKQAAEAYSKIITRYPMMMRAADAEERLKALQQRVPRPTKAAVALNKKEQESRVEASTFAKVMGSFRKHPDTSQASKVGEPTMVDPKPVSAYEVVQEASRSAMGSGGGQNTVSIETVKSGAPPPSGEVPRSDSPQPIAAQPPAPTPEPTPEPASTEAAAGELKPNVPDPNELKPLESAAPEQAPAQVNQIDPSSQAQAGQPAAATASDPQNEEDMTYSSSKRKKKSGIRKVVPF
jgi:outer membrane protein assembly factor BamD